MKKKIVIGICVLVIIISAIFITSMGIINANSEKEAVRVASVFGCVELKDKYTDAEWEAKENLDNLLFKKHLVRCP